MPAQLMSLEPESGKAYVRRWTGTPARLGSPYFAIYAYPVPRTRVYVKLYTVRGVAYGIAMARCGCGRSRVYEYVGNNYITRREYGQWLSVKYR